MSVENLQKEMNSIMKEFGEQPSINKGKVLVVGCSTSEVIGEKIGTAGTADAAKVIFSELQDFASKRDIHLAFQCCEHLNRALVVERQTAIEKNLEEVTVVPTRLAGGAMATYAFEQFADPVVVEYIKADAGLDIGDTFIGMHLKHVAVPVRISQKHLGHAHVTLAVTRPKLIGGARAVYEQQKLNDRCNS